MEEMNKFTKADLKDGMLLRSRSGFLWKVIGDDLFDSSGEKDYDLSHFDENLRCRHTGESDFTRHDIMSATEIVEKEIWTRQEWFKISGEDRKWLIGQEGIDKGVFVPMKD